jgi:hypothetical protein
MDLKVQSDIKAVPLNGNEQLWQDFLTRSANGTLFHDLEFLGYHPHGRFRFHHLILMHAGNPVALVPGGLEGPDERPVFSSPVGASIGGLVVAAPLRAETSLAMVEALQNYARDRGWAGILFTLPPTYYCFQTAGLIEFALFCRGFQFEHRWLCPALQLEPISNAFERICRPRQASFVRAGRRKGVRCIVTGIDGFSYFLKPFRDTYARHGVPATHSEEEIQDLLVRFPDRVRIHLAMLEQEPIAALLVLKLSTIVANTFYICSNAAHSREHGPALLIADAMDRLSAAGFRYLDLRPSASDQKFNRGNTFFKEGLGAVGHCRDRWRWDVLSETSP